MQTTQVRLTRNLEYQLEDRWIKVDSGTIINFCEDEGCGFVANENELFSVANDHVEPINGLALVPAHSESLQEA